MGLCVEEGELEKFRGGLYVFFHRGNLPLGFVFL